MPGLFTGEWAKKLTELSNHYLDWSRVGNLLQARHRYSLSELAARGTILASTMAGGALAVKMDDSDELWWHSIYGMGGALAGFAISHTIVILPLIVKRFQLAQICKEQQQQLALNLKFIIYHFNISQEDKTVLVKQIKEFAQTIMDESLSDDKQARATQTWGRRALLMKKINLRLEYEVDAFDKDQLTLDEIKTYWRQEQSNLIKALRLFDINEIQKASVVENIETMKTASMVG